MHLGAQFLEPFLVCDAKMLLFIDNDEAEILEFDLLGQKGMRADNDIDRAIDKPLLDRLQIPGADKA
jgi:hypothetical protein